MPHALHSTGMLGGPLRQQGEDAERQSGLVQGPSTRARVPPGAARPLGPPGAPRPAPRVRGMRQRLAGRCGWLSPGEAGARPMPSADSGQLPSPQLPQMPSGAETRFAVL